jgi:hypothetical protein
VRAIERTAQRFLCGLQNGAGLRGFAVKLKSPEREQGQNQTQEHEHAGNDTEREGAGKDRRWFRSRFHQK